MRRLRGPRIRDERGFSLVEMVVVCVVLGFVMAGLTTIFVGSTHSELRLEQRFQAQQTARLALNGLRSDIHSACAANVGSSGAVLVLAFVPSGGQTQCGAVSTNPKATWCTVANTTGGWSLYRSSGTAACDATALLEAQNLTTSTPFSTAATIPVEQRQTVSVTLPIQVPAAPGQPWTLGESLALGNGVYTKVGSTTACSTSDQTVCPVGLCPLGSTCYPPVVQ